MFHVVLWDDQYPEAKAGFTAAAVGTVSGYKE